MKIQFESIEQWQSKVKSKDFILSHFEEMVWILDLNNDSLEIFSNQESIRNLMILSVNTIKESLQQRYELLCSTKNDPFLVFGRETHLLKQDLDVTEVSILTNIDLDEQLIYGCTLIQGQSMDSDVSNHILVQQKKILELMDENVQLNQLIRKDRMTKLYNKAFIEEQLHLQCSTVQRYKRNCSIIFFDLDHFKQVNDNYGHAVGDEVLITLARISEKNIRVSDLLARWGGEEFLIVLPETELNQALVVATKLKELIETHPFSSVEKMTASFGVTQILESDTPLSVLHRCDKALYKAKNSGRNQVAHYRSDEEIPFASLKITWRHVWDSGHPNIDLQHRQLIDMANQLLELTTMQTSKAEVLHLLDTLIQHTAQHFAYEEHVLKSLNYDQLEDHMLKHQLLIEKALQLRKEYMEDKGYMSAFFSFIIEDVIVKHLVQEDTRFFPTIRKHRH